MGVHLRRRSTSGWSTASSRCCSIRRVRSHNVWVTDDLAAVAMWDAPIETEHASGYAEDLWAGYRAIAGDDAFERLTVYNNAVAAHTPAEPHWYLGILATHPAAPARGSRHRGSGTCSRWADQASISLLS